MYEGLITWDIATIGSAAIILGMPWLEQANLTINWEHKTVHVVTRPVGSQYEVSTLVEIKIPADDRAPPSAFDRFFNANQQHKLKIVKYPDVGALGLAAGTDTTGDEVAAGTAQGVGPHKDSMLTSYLLQVPPHTGLQALNPAGKWIDCPPLPGTFVVAIGQGLEALTSGICASTTHRVLGPSAGLGPRYSVPFFQGVSYDATFESVECPAWVRALRSEVLGGWEGRGTRWSLRSRGGDGGIWARRH
ncbi:MAG: hypothetical protein FRX48_03296 [Lasallia pustulata]|uniref:Fe2OG dioxygenase domain-containing protein n=1 Tax=Lasallia pustulata TaxID=136370 RepID=A0A5M8PV98_9LECA|nr:MAG: hypothetical protein FRX48_03296 [Lasallia pustulata]